MEVTIEKLIYGGDGLARHDGATVFVPFVIPGEVVSIQETERKKKFIRGLPETIVKPSPERATPPCPHFQICGGCHYQHIPYESQLRYKEEILRETLRRIGKIDWKGPITTHSAAPLNYRNRAQWKVRDPENGASARNWLFPRGVHRTRADRDMPDRLATPRRNTRRNPNDVANRELPPSLREVGSLRRFDG